MKSDFDFVFRIWGELVDHHLPPHIYSIEYDDFLDVVIIRMSLSSFPCGSLDDAEVDRLRHPSSLVVSLSGGFLLFKRRFENEEFSSFTLADPNFFSDVSRFLRDWVRDIYSGILFHIDDSIVFYKKNSFKLVGVDQRIIECRKARAFALSILRRL